MLLLGLDLETTGLDLDEDRVIESGLVHWDTESNQPVRLNGFLVKPDIYITDKKWAEITKINGITKDLVDKYGMDVEKALTHIMAWVKLSDAVVTFNGTEFDKPMLLNWMDRAACLFDKEVVWVDTRLDPLEPLDRGSLILQCALAGFLNPFPHRAVTDVLSMFKLLGQQDMLAMVARSKFPTITVAASVSYDDKEKAKARGYFWDGEKSRRWLKKIKEFDLEKEREEAPFPVQFPVS